MTTMTPIQSTTLVERAAALGPELASHAARHDTDGTFVTEGYDALRHAGLLAAAVPEATLVETGRHGLGLPSLLQ